MRRVMVLLCLGLGGLTALAGCGGTSSGVSSATAASGGKAVAIDVGTGKPVMVHKSKPRIGFLWTSGNLFLQAQKKGAVAEAKRLGLPLTVFDSKFDPTTQMSQAQNVLQQHRFDALIVVPLDTNAMCKVVTQQAPQQGVPVVTNNVPACNRVALPEGTQLWSPGTIAHVGWTATADSNRWMYQEVAKERGPGHHVAALMVGPPLIGGTISSIAALKQAKAMNEIPNLDVKYVVNTDFTTPDGFAKTQNLLQAHPDIDTIMTIYSDITIGVIKAVKAKGDQGKVQVFDQGASGQSLAAIRAGDLKMTTAFFPYSMGADAVKAVADAFAGEKIPRWIGEYKQGSTPGKPLIITARNIGQFKPEY